jgi:hypothetical protein
MKLWKNFEADNADDYANDYEDGLDEDDLDMFEGDDSFEDYGFEENWNSVKITESRAKINDLSNVIFSGSFI